MHKQSYVHVHSLLVEVAHYLVREEGMPIDTIDTYRAESTRPSSLHQSKAAHHAAIMALLADIEPWLEEKRETGSAPSMERPPSAAD